MTARLSGPVGFDERQRLILVLVGLGSMLSAFTNTLFTQTVAYAADEFGVDNTGQGLGAAVVRWGILFAIPVVARADSGAAGR